MKILALLRQPRFLVVVAALLLGGVLGLGKILSVGGGAGSGLEGRLNVGQAGVTTHTLPVVPCDLNQGPCSLVLSEAVRMQVRFSPLPVVALKPFAVEVDFEKVGQEASASAMALPQHVQLDFSGVEMEMGFNQLILSASAPGRFAGQGSLPVCVTGPMQWQANITVEGPPGQEPGRWVVPFRFLSGV